MTNPPIPKGRGTPLKPPNRFEKVVVEDDWEHLEHDEDHFTALQQVPTEYLPDNSRTVISENDSPDLGFRFSLNPFRGCSHGCSYCYARPTHEYLGLNAGLDFETKIFFKENAPKLLRDWLNRPGWSGQTIMLSGVTDCYQPVERELRITRQCLEVMLEARQPVGIVTKNSLVTRDLDLLGEMARMGTACAAISLTTLDQELTRVLEPRTAAPAARLRVLRELSEAGVPAQVLMAPIIPGLTDSEIPAMLEAASEAGAYSASFQLLRLPLTVKPVFLEWLQRERPSQAERIESRLRATREGQLNVSEFGKRMSGTGEIATQIRQTFDVFSRKFGLNRKADPLDSSQFRPPKSSSGQMRLF